MIRTAEPQLHLLVVALSSLLLFPVASCTAPLASNQSMLYADRHPTRTDSVLALDRTDPTTHAWHSAWAAALGYLEGTMLSDQESAPEPRTMLYCPFTVARQWTGSTCNELVANQHGACDPAVEHAMLTDSLKVQSDTASSFIQTSACHMLIYDDLLNLGPHIRPSAQSEYTAVLNLSDSAPVTVGGVAALSGIGMNEERTECLVFGVLRERGVDSPYGITMLLVRNELGWKLSRGLHGGGQGPMHVIR